MVSRALAAVVLGPRWPSCGYCPTPGRCKPGRCEPVLRNPWPPAPAVAGPVLYDRERPVMA